MSQWLASSPSLLLFAAAAQTRQRSTTDVKPLTISLLLNFQMGQAILSERLFFFLPVQERKEGEKNAGGFSGGLGSDQ